MTRYAIHHPEHYPVGWVTAAKLAAKELLVADQQGRPRPEQSSWVSADWARGEAGAICRMKRLRAFKEGLKRHGTEYAGAGEVMALGYELTFRKVEVRGVWDVQLSWKLLSEQKAQMMETLKEVMG